MEQLIISCFQVQKQIKMNIELTDEEVKIIVSLMDGASVPLSKAEECIVLYKKFKNAE